MTQNTVMAAVRYVKRKCVCLIMLKIWILSVFNLIL